MRQARVVVIIRSELLKKILVPGLPALAFGAEVLASTGHGIGITPDSVMYILMARNVAGGGGFAVLGAPITWFPPLYPLLLAFSRIAGADPLAGARLVQAILGAGNIFWIGALAYRFSGKSLTAGFVAGLTAGFAVDVIAYHTLALSDGLMLFFCLPALLCLARYFETERSAFLIAAAACSALAALTRYAGLGWIAGGVGSILLFSPRRGRGKARELLLFGTIALLPTAAWWLRNSWYATPMGRPLDIHGFFGQKEAEGLNHAFSAWLAQWKAPDGPWLTAAGLVLLLLLGWRIWSGRNRTTPGAGRDIAVILPFFMLYGFFLVGAAAFFQADLFRDSARLLLPLHALAIVGLVAWGKRMIERAKSPAFSSIASVMFAVVCTAEIGAGVGYLDRIAADGQGYAGERYRSSPLIRKVTELDPHTMIYANLVLPIALYGGRMPSYIPSKIVNGTQRPNPRYADEMDEMALKLADGSAVVVLFDQGSNWLVQPSIREIEDRIPISCISRVADGGIYRARSPAE